MRDAGLDTDIELIAGGRFEDDGWKAADQLLETGSATAVFTYNDQCSVGLIARLRDRGVAVPGDVSVVGFDDTPGALGVAGVDHDRTGHRRDRATRWSWRSSDPTPPTGPERRSSSLPDWS